MKKAPKMAYSFRITQELRERLNAYVASKEIAAGWVIRNLLNKYLPKNISNNDKAVKD